MKNKPYVTILLMFLFCSCNMEYIGEEASKEEASSKVFSYETVLNSSAWQSYTSTRERINACQLPDSVLKNASTADLVAYCASMPMNAICYAYDNPMEGARWVMQNFNGFKELQRRKDAAAAILDFYEGVDFTKTEQTPYPITLRDSRNRCFGFTNISFMELAMASDAIPALYEKANVARLESVAIKKYEEKISNSVVFGTVALSSSLLIEARIKLNSKSLDYSDEKKIHEFYESGGKNCNIQEISQVIFVNH